VNALAFVYLFSYFVGNGEDGLHLAKSRDALHWEAVGGGKSFLQPTVGENKLMRDPCLIQGPDGMFRMVWTTGWYGRTVGYGASKDLLHWTQEALPVMAKEPTAANCWAPEIVYNPAKNDYLVYWSTTIPGRFVDEDERLWTAKTPIRNHRIYCTTTSDFKTWTPTRLLYDPGFNVIDATIDRASDGSWVMFAKNETALPKPAKFIFSVRSGSPEGPYSPPSPRITGDFWAEGPTAIEIGGVWHVYFDRYRDHRFGLVISKDLVHWQDISDQLVMPKDIRHGTVLKVDDGVLTALEAAKP